MSIFKQRRSSLVFLGVFLGIFLLFTPGCKEAAEVFAELIIYNECGLSIDVFMDGAFNLSIADLENGSISGIRPGEHDFLATKMGTSFEVESVTYNVLGAQNLLWHVQCPASVKVKNEYGQTLRIYTDGVYRFDLDNQLEATMTNVPYGWHRVEARQTIDDTQVAFKDIEIVDNIEYIWTITP
jgi:hypothetical protein